MTDAPEATEHNAPPLPTPAAAAPAAHDAPAATPRDNDAGAARPTETPDAPEHAQPAGDEAVVGAGTDGAPRARRSRGGRGRRRSGHAAQADAGSAAENESIEKSGDAGETTGPDALVPPQPRQQARPRPAPQGQQQRQPQQKQKQPPQHQQQPRKVHPVLQRLFELYPKMFGARFLPLKLGVYQELLERHGDEFKAEDLKLALGLHARSTRYLDAVAAGHQRHDLEGEPVEPVAPEHVHHAILEVFRRRQSRSPEDLGGQLRERIIAAIEASGIGREAYAERVRARDAHGNAALDDALAELGRQGAKREALLRAFEASGKTEAEFADMYGMETREVTRTLQRARKDKADAQAFAAAAQAAADAAGNGAAGDEPDGAMPEPEAEATAAPAEAEAPVEAEGDAEPIVQPAISKPEA